MKTKRQIGMCPHCMDLIAITSDMKIDEPTKQEALEYIKKHSKKD